MKKRTTVFYQISSWLVIISGIIDLLNNGSVSGIRYGILLMILILNNIMISSYESLIKICKDKIKRYGNTNMNNENE